MAFTAFHRSALQIFSILSPSQELTSSLWQSPTREIQQDRYPIFQVQRGIALSWLLTRFELTMLNYLWITRLYMSHFITADKKYQIMPKKHIYPRESQSIKSPPKCCVYGLDCTREPVEPRSFQGPKAGPGPTPKDFALRARDVRCAHIDHPTRVKQGAFSVWNPRAPRRIVTPLNPRKERLHIN